MDKGVYIGLNGFSGPVEAVELVQEYNKGVPTIKLEFPFSSWADYYTTIGKHKFWKTK